MSQFPIIHGLTLAANAYIENFNVEQLAADPVPVGAGRAWYNSTDKVWKHSTLDANGGVIVRTFATAEDLAAAVSTLTTALNAEKTRAEAAETAITGNLASEVARAQGAEQALGLRIDALGSAFNYVATLAGGASAAEALDLSSLTQKDTGDYYKVATAGWFKIGSGAAFHANLNDGLVWNLNGAIDIIDNTDSAVAGTAGFIAVTGSTETGFVVDVDTAFKGRVSTLETDLAAESVARASADSALDVRVTAVEQSANNKMGDLATLTTDAKNTLVAALNEIDAHADATQAALTAEIANRAAADTAIRSDYNARNFSFTAGSAATVHTISHNLNVGAENLDVSVWVQRPDGKFRNDLVSVEVTDNNTLNVYLTSAQIVKASVRSLAAL